ncbi:hypothetical protein WJX72_002185 [[Myrmecia] bisecta]|uniref:Uncharacterized protein n=1 Tax=[Myrmecia] bisecta TaxID=41462 RepID=A0AAW1QA18_9CHLO
MPDSTLRKLLVANRGEIACRVLQTACRLGLPTVAVYSEADRNSLHIKHADEAFCIGPEAARDSYLRKDRILGVALRTGANAIHPGYGFLSENAGFAQLCQDSGIAFVGPPASAIRAMGDKSEAKAMMSAAGVPVVPGYHGKDQAHPRLVDEAGKMGFPILIKATLGGGGKGMKLATCMDDLEDAINSAKREASASFGDDRVLLERFIERPRHIEVQVFADSHGNAIYLSERDCSVQRRHQKVIEEAPAPNVSDEFRRSIGEAAVAAAKAVGYVNAGTVEFIVDTDTGDYFFMEMNTRLQVEHPVTEMVTGLDLVDWQLQVAAGGCLPLSQDQVQVQGHAFEGRLYAENPEKGFLPGAGQVRRWQVPDNATFFTTAGDVRVDSGVQEGDMVGVHYDPMIAKVIARGEDRNSALANLHKALSELQVAGLHTNQAFLKRIAKHPAFIAAELDTSFIKKHEESLTGVQPPAQEVVALAAVAKHHVAVQKVAQETNWRRRDAWSASDSLRLGHELTMPMVLSHPLSEAVLPLRLTFHRGGAITVQGDLPGQATPLAQRVEHIRLEGDRLSAEVAGQRLKADVMSYQHLDDEVLNLWVGGDCHEFRAAVPRKWSRTGSAATAAGNVVTPMPGKVIKVLVRDGEVVEEGDSRYEQDIH